MHIKIHLPLKKQHTWGENYVQATFKDKDKVYIGITKTNFAEITVC